MLLAVLLSLVYCQLRHKIQYAAVLFLHTPAPALSLSTSQTSTPPVTTQATLCLFSLWRVRAGSADSEANVLPANWPDSTSRKPTRRTLRCLCPGQGRLEARERQRHQDGHAPGTQGLRSKHGSCTVCFGTIDEVVPPLPRWHVVGRIQGWLPARAQNIRSAQLV